LRAWCDPDDEDWPLAETLWLLPREWYDAVPEGFPIVDISGGREEFKHGTTDNDVRFGYLAFGILAR
jgi:hypothetical protein